MTDWLLTDLKVYLICLDRVSYWLLVSCVNANKQKLICNLTQQPCSNPKLEKCTGGRILPNHS